MAWASTFLFDLIGNCEGRVVFLRLANRLSQFQLSIDQGLHGIVSKAERLVHRVFIHLTGTSLDHQQGFFGTGHPQVQLRFIQLVVGRVDDEFAIDQADADCADRSAPGGVGDQSRLPKRR